MQSMLSSAYDWQNKLVIGQGAHSIVYKIKHRDRDEYYAIKQFKRKNPQSQQSYKNELECLKKIKHNNIIKLYSNFQNDEVACEILQYCENDLRKVMQVSGQQKQIPEKEAIGYIRQIIEGMLELHRHNLIHRDLKPDNILIKQKTIKICDFGLTAYCSQTINFNSYCGTPSYMSPQVSGEQVYSSKADIWSLGIIFYEMLYGKTPWKFNETTYYKTHIRDNPLVFPSNILLSKLSRDFIEKCLEVEEKDRIDWEGVANHPIVNLGNKIVVQIQILEVNELIETLADLYSKQQLQTKLFTDSYQNSLNMLEFFKKIRKLFPHRQITLRQSRLIFEKMDYNKNGKVALQEFKKVLSKLGNSYLTLSNIVDIVKQKKLTSQIFIQAKIPESTLFLDKKQFQNIVKIINPQISYGNIKKVFERLDKDEDDKISKAEVYQLFELKQPSYLSMRPSYSVELIVPNQEEKRSKSRSKSPISHTVKKSPERR